MIQQRLAGKVGPAREIDECANAPVQSPQPVGQADLGTNPKGAPGMQIRSTRFTQCSATMSLMAVRRTSRSNGL
jgi:hypothetical protein